MAQIREEYEQKLAGLDVDLKEKERIIRERNRAIAQLTEERDKARMMAGEWGKEYAEKNLKQVSEMYKEAYRYFLNGEIDQAMKTLDDAKMDQALAAARKQKEEAEKAIQQSIENYMLKARLCIIGFQFAEAEKNFQKAVDAEPENLENTFEFAVYLEKQNKELKALPLYEKALFLAEKRKNEGNIATVLNNLGNLYWNKNNYMSAEKAYSRALDIYENLSEANPSKYLLYMARAQNNFGLLYQSENDYRSAEKAYSRALDIYENLSKSNSDTYMPDIAMIQNNMGLFYATKNEYASAEKVFQRALDIYEKISKTNPDKYLPALAEIQNNLGFLYNYKNDYASAEKAYQHALKIFEKLSESNPDRYDPYVAGTQNNLGRLFLYKNEWVTAEKKFLYSLEIFEKLSKINPDTYLPDVAMTLANFAIFHKEMLTKEPTEFHKEKGLEYAKRVMEIAVKFPHVPRVQEYRKGAEEVKQYLETVSIEELQTRKQAAEYGSLSWKYLFDRQFAKAGEAAQKGIALDPSQEWIKTNLASSFLFTGQWDKAKAIYLELKDKKDQHDETKTYRDVFLEDLNALEKAGITHPDMAKVREMLKEP
ncbi:MAG: tetratricopeptide repeat protein [Desulfococcaceae bacterium]